jgi:hypothetical protein
MKGPIIALAFAQLNWNREDIKKIIHLFGWLTVCVLTLGLINLAVPGLWVSVLANNGRVDYRYGIPSLIGPFTHPVGFGQFTALAFIAIFSYRALINKSRASMILLTLVGVANVLSVRRKSTAGMLGGALGSRLSVRIGRLGFIFSTLITAPLILMLSYNPLTLVVRDLYNQYFNGSDEVARIVMYEGAAQIAVRDFPFGAGLGRFGSYLAGVRYSPEYVNLGFPTIYGLGTGKNALYLTDTFWPALVGESGVLGSLAYTFGLFGIASLGLKARRQKDKYVQLVSVILIGWSIEYAIESIASPVYSAPPLFALYFGLAGIVASIHDSRVIESDENKVDSENLRSLAQNLIFSVRETPTEARAHAQQRGAGQWT